MTDLDVTEIKLNPSVVRIMRALPSWITPNGVSYFRMFALTPPLFLAALAGWHWTAITLILLAALSDFVDGALAFARNQESEEGAFLDPLADKINNGGALVALLIEGSWRLTTPIVTTLVAETLLTLVRIPAMCSKAPSKEKATKVKANKVGKAKMIAQVVSLLLLFLAMALLPEQEGIARNVAVTGFLLFYVSTGLALTSLYTRRRDIVPTLHWLFVRPFRKI